MRRTQSSDSVAASKNPRARSIAVSPAVMLLLIVKRGANGADLRVERQLAELIQEQGAALGFTELAARLVCETTLLEGIEAEVPPPAEKRIAIAGKFLDEVRIRLDRTSYLGFPVENYRAEIATDGTATIWSRCPRRSSSSQEAG